MYAHSIVLTITMTIVLVAIVVIYIMVRSLLKEHLRERTRENKKMEEELGQKLPGVNDGSILVCYFNRRTLVMDFDPEKAKLAGLPTHHWTYHSFRKILNSDCTNVFEMWIFKYAKMHNNVKRRLRFHLSFDGGKTYQWWEMIYEIDEKNAYDDGLYGLFVNIDKVKDIENAIDDYQQQVYNVEMKEALLATINHDIRTPLNAVSGFATLLAEQYDDFSEEEREEFSQIVCSNSESMLSLTESIKSMSDNEIADKGYRTMPKSVTELLNFCYTTNRIICPSHLTFRLSMPEGVEDKYINIDSMRIERVINNFLSNAFKFTSVGEVVLGWKYLADTGQVEIYVTDSGIGVSKENQKKIFDEFIKLNEHAYGTGLGLNICKKIVERHEGEIGVVSELGQGSTFYCRFNTVEKS